MSSSPSASGVGAGPSSQGTKRQRTEPAPQQKTEQKPQKTLCDALNDQLGIPDYVQAYVLILLELRHSGHFNMVLPTENVKCEVDWPDVMVYAMTLYLYRRFRIAKSGSTNQLVSIHVRVSTNLKQMEEEMIKWKRTQSPALLQELEDLMVAACCTKDTFPRANLNGPIELRNAHLISVLKELYEPWVDPPYALRVCTSIQPRTRNLAHMKILMGEAEETRDIRSRVPPGLIDLNSYQDLQKMINTFKSFGIEQCLCAMDPPPMPAWVPNSDSE